MRPAQSPPPQTAMATAASQPYIARLGFQDPDRAKDRHGLACEYLFERLLELEAAPSRLKEYIRGVEEDIREAARKNQYARAQINEYQNRAAYEKYVQDFTETANTSYKEWTAAKAMLDAIPPNLGLALAMEDLPPASCLNVPIRSGYSTVGFADVLIDDLVLGEVKITKQPAEQVLQQINFYRSHKESIRAVYVLTDYDCSDLRRLTEGSDIKVFRLGRRFEEWIQSGPSPESPEL